MDQLTGNENPQDFAEVVADAMRAALEESDTAVLRVSVVSGFQPYVVVELRNGAEWQLTPVRSGWPTDGTSAQFDDVNEDEPDHR